MRVLSWNLWWRFGDWRARHDAILAILAEVQPDVCGLQEVWTAPDANQAELFATELGGHWAYSPAPRPSLWQARMGYTTIDVGNAVLSRWPIAATLVERLPGDARTVLHARIEAPGGPIPFFTTHLDPAPYDSAARCAQVTVLAKFVAANANGVDAHPPVVTGDFNAEPDSDEMRLIGGHLTAPAVPGLVLVDAWRYAHGSIPGWTWDRRNPHVAALGTPSARIDYVLVGMSGHGRWNVEQLRVAGTEPVDGVWPSDHAAVVVDLTSIERVPT